MRKKISIGSWITLSHPSIAEIMADSGFDWLCIDMEHSVIDYFEAQQLILTIQSKGLKAYVIAAEFYEASEQNAKLAKCYYRIARLYDKHFMTAEALEYFIKEKN